jgi:hypothetical protein
MVCFLCDGVHDPSDCLDYWIAFRTHHICTGSHYCASSYDFSNYLSLLQLFDNFHRDTDNNFSVIGDNAANASSVYSFEYIRNERNLPHKNRNQRSLLVSLHFCVEYIYWAPLANHLYLNDLNFKLHLPFDANISQTLLKAVILWSISRMMFISICFDLEIGCLA